MEDLLLVSWELLLPIVIIQFVLMLIALVDIIKAKETKGPKVMWVLIVVLINLFGPIAYFIFGRKK
ncbi:PLD nuclease N-terminal domain-containing protein [Bacillus sp. PS06]|uniref:PLD nuclease N-terminal domain-containing protein n=1 Tax=Bacillus sp. PS06 TaxID=2764176 RepID=UPI0017849BC2|nr:PLD nuclease N-terminal domain-containing protein [Bacillus sp. PS06]MBD8069476.1 PLDc_N domain-containing protein [Bacillus sp. PS06]